jgi:ABC-2 type transport system ATP-binding protein
MTARNSGSAFLNLSPRPATTPGGAMMADQGMRAAGSADRHGRIGVGGPGMSVTAPGPTGPMIRTVGLGRAFGDRHAVRDLDLEVAPGEVFGLLGPNGAGKTTTIAMLTTLLGPTAGTAVIGGLDVVTEPDAVRRTLGYVMQRVPVRFNMTGREILELEAALYHVPRRQLAGRVGEMLALTDLAADADRLFQHYSGGMQKRLDIACALVHRPALLILDEPTLGLDVPSRHRVWQQIGALRDEGVTVLLATNYLDEADLLCDRLMIIDGGRPVVQGTPDDLKRHLGGDVLTVGSGDPARVAALLDGRSWARHVVTLPESVRVQVDDAATHLPEVMALCAAAGVRVTTVTYRQPSLDDVFLRHTGGELQPSGRS